jgi:hypothetical protein
MKVFLVRMLATVSFLTTVICIDKDNNTLAWAIGDVFCAIFVDCVLYLAKNEG